MLWQWVSAKLCGIEQRVLLILGRAAITLGIAHILVFVMFSLTALEVKLHSTLITFADNNNDDDKVEVENDEKWKYPKF